jgi:excinuclease ABC subunit B
MAEKVFHLKSQYKPDGDQPVAISQLVQGLRAGMHKQTLLGATGTGKTFTVANVINEMQKPALVIAHNKTLAAQLAQEFRQFFPDAAVHYFVSYYDYYQPEAYMPTTDTYIEKDAQINKEIDRLRHATTQALLTRKDVIIVASVSCIYGLGSPEDYEKENFHIKVGDVMGRNDVLKRLVHMRFERTPADLTPGTFRSIGNRVDIMPVSETMQYQIEILGGAITRITKIDPVSSKILGELDSMFLFPAKHFMTADAKLEKALKNIKTELEEQLKYFEKEGKLLEAERIGRRTKYDLAMMREVGYCSGIENYSRQLSGKLPGEAPETLLSYFPSNTLGTGPHAKKAPDFLTFIDESHVTLPQLGGMYAGDASRKNTLVEFGFRLPSAKDNRPLKYDEFEERVGQTIYVSATPSDREREMSSQVVEQIIRPTGLVDPETIVRPVTPAGDYVGQVQDFIIETEKTIKKGFRVLATTLTKKMAEDLSVYLKERKIKAEYLHSDIKTIERIQILTKFRQGEFDVLVGVNLLREGLDLPEVALIGILDADKEGFLRSDTALIQTIGRAARNVEGRVILYADNMTGSLERALGETNRRRAIQLAYNKKHKITPKTIIKKISDIAQELESEHSKAVNAELMLDIELFKKTFEKDKSNKGKTESQSIKNSLMSDDERNNLVYEKIIKLKEKGMNKAVKELDFETAAILRDEIMVLKERMEK